MFAAGAETSHVTKISSLSDIARGKTALQDELAKESFAMEFFEQTSMNDFMEKHTPTPHLRSTGPVAFLMLENQEPLEIRGGTTVPPAIPLIWYCISHAKSLQWMRKRRQGDKTIELQPFCPL